MAKNRRAIAEKLLEEIKALPHDKDDVEVEDLTSEFEDELSSPSNYQISTYPADFTLEVLWQKWKNDDIQIPSFQRKFVWKLSQSSKLIESFLVGLPVPAIFLYTDRKSQKFFVIDGQQRLKTVFFFFEGYFGEPVDGKRQVFELTGLSDRSPYYGASFAELSEQDQARFKNSVLRAFIVQQLDPNDDTSIYHIFERLNTGGTLLTNQEVRNCVYHGNLNELLFRLNTMREWREILGKSKPDSRFKDIELILRFFSLLDLNGYTKPMKDHLSRFMRRNASISAAQAAEFALAFEGTCRAVLGTLGKKPFHVRAGLNAAVYDSVMVAFAHTKTIPGNAAERYKKLLEREDYQKYTRQSTTDEETVKQRFKLAAETLFG
jgi:hypothetical protein